MRILIWIGLFKINELSVFYDIKFNLLCFIG